MKSVMAANMAAFVGRCIHCVLKAVLMKSSVCPPHHVPLISVLMWECYKWVYFSIQLFPYLPLLCNADSHARPILFNIPTTGRQAEVTSRRASSNEQSSAHSCLASFLLPARNINTLWISVLFARGCIITPWCQTGLLSTQHIICMPAIVQTLPSCNLFVMDVATHSVDTVR